MIDLMEYKNLTSNSLYNEEILSKGLIYITTSIMIISLLMLWYQLFIESLNPPILNWIYILIILISLITVNFSKLAIRITPQEITVRFGIISYKQLWTNVSEVTLDKTSIIKYGGWGIRIGRFGGKWRLIFNVIGKKCLLLQLNKGKFQEFVFSTTNPEEIVKIIKERVLVV